VCKFDPKAEVNENLSFIHMRIMEIFTVEPQGIFSKHMEKVVLLCKA
jgi:hypothetical protein